MDAQAEAERVLAEIDEAMSADKASLSEASEFLEEIGLGVDARHAGLQEDIAKQASGDAS
jgi:hypothetical protein